MREPGKLTLYGEMSKSEREQLSDLLDNLSGTNSFKVLENLLDGLFLPFLDIFQGDSLKIPEVKKVITRITYLRIYNDSKSYPLLYLAKKYKKKPDTVEKIINCVHEEISCQGGYTHGEAQK